MSSDGTIIVKQLSPSQTRNIIVTRKSIVLKKEEIQISQVDPAEERQNPSLMSDSLAKLDGPEKLKAKQDFFTVNSYKVLSELNNSSSCSSFNRDLNVGSDLAAKVLPRRKTQAYETSEKFKFKRMFSGSHQTPETKREHSQVVRLSLKNFVSDTPLEKVQAVSRDPTKISVISRENIKFNIPRNAPNKKVKNDLRRQKSEVNISKSDKNTQMQNDKSHKMLFA